MDLLGTELYLIIMIMIMIIKIMMKSQKLAYNHKKRTSSNDENNL